MPDLFCTICGAPAPHAPQERKDYRVLWIFGLPILLATGLVLIALINPWEIVGQTEIPTQSSLPNAIPSPIVITFPTLSPTPTPNPLIPPTYQIVIVTTPTPAPTATLTSPQVQGTSIVQTQVAGLLPQACEETTVTPGGDGKVCYWKRESPTSTPLPDYPSCGTPLPGAYCLKEN